MKRASRRWHGWGWILGATAMVALTTVQAVAQPANDFFTNATTIAGQSGIFIGDNINATLEAGEPVLLDVGGFPANGASVWFRWVAPVTGTVTFDTFGSPGLDTMLGGYEGTNLATLVLLASNDDTVPFVQSRISWLAQMGTEYRVVLDGWNGAQGLFLLNWMMSSIQSNAPPPVAGQIQYETDKFLVSEGAPGYATISVTYGGGAPGAVSVGYFTQDGTAQDGLDYESRSGTLTFQFGESNKTFTVPIFDNAVPNVARTVNLSLINPVGATLGPVSNAVLTIVDDETVPFIATSGRFEFSTNFFFGTEFETFPFPGGPSGFSELHNIRGVAITVNRLGGSTGRVLVDYRTAPVLDPFFGGIDGVDYTATNGTIVFDDGQTSTNFVLAVSSISPFLGAIFNDKTVPLELSNPRAAPGENPAVIVPTLGLITNATLTILDVTVLPTPGGGLTLDHFAFERLNYRGDEYGRAAFDSVTGQFFDTTNDFSYIGIDILHPSGGAASVNLDLVALYSNLRFPGLPLSAGSDNADLSNGLFRVFIGPDTFYQPFPNTAFSDGSDVITNFPDVDPMRVQFPRTAPGGPLNGVFCVGCTVANPVAPVAFGHRLELRFAAVTTRATVFIPIVNDGVVEFNEDVALQLTRLGGNPPVHPSGAFATMTIIDDEQPSGIADRDWNPDNVFYTTNHPYNMAPGANNTVNALAVDSTNKTIIVGDFTAYNGILSRSVARLNSDGSLDASFTTGTGANGPIADVAIYRPIGSNGVTALSGKVMIAGPFSSYNNLPRAGIARLNADGTLDTSFNPGAGVTRNGNLGIVRSIAWQNDGRVLIAGDFTHYNGIERNGVARINQDGSLDTRFDAGVGPNDTVWTLSLLETSPPFITGAGTAGGPAEDINVVDTGGRQGTITVMADFVFVPDRMIIVYEGKTIYDTGLWGGALNPISFDGTTNFSVNFGPGQSTVVTIIMNPGNGELGTVWEYTASIVTVGEDKKMMIGGDFTSVNGVAINRLARLNSNGALDPSFNPGGGFDGTVRAIAVQGDNRVVVGGAFHSVDFRTRNSIARVMPDGSLDTSYDPGTGFDAPVYALQLDPSGKMLCGGPFSSFNATRRIGMARLFTHGALDTSFLDTAYNQFAGLIRGLSEEPRSFVNRFGIQTDGSIMIGGSFTNIGCKHTIEQCETNWLPRTVVGFTNQLLFETHAWNRQEKRARYNVARVIGGRTPGPGNVQFTFPNYSVDENGQDLTVTMTRVDGRLGTLSADIVTSNRTAVVGSDFSLTRARPFWVEDVYNNAPVNIGAPYSIGYVEVEYFKIPILNDALREGDEMFDLGLFTPVASVTLGGEFIPLGGALSRTFASATIVDEDFDHGIIAFAKPVFTANEGDQELRIDLVRTNGSSGVVGFQYYFLQEAADTARGGVDFTNAPGNQLFSATFGQGVTNLTIAIRVFDDNIAEPDKSFRIVITNATGGASLASSGVGLSPSAVATAVIIDNDHASGRLNFISANFATNESAGVAIISVARVDGSLGPLSVNVTTTPGTATPGADYTPVTATLSWVNGDSGTRLFTVPVFTDGLVEPAETVNLSLFGFSNPTSVGFQTNAVLTIINDDAFGTLSFSQPFYDANENGTNLIIIVNRIGGLAGTISATFQTENGTAIEGLDYIANSGVLTFLPGEFSKYFEVTLLNNDVADGDRTITLRLTNFVSTAGSSPVATVRIIDDESSNVPAGTLDTTFDPIAGADAPVYTLAYQPDGNILIGGDFKTVNRVTRNRMARLHPNGLLDPSFNAGLGPNRPVRSMWLQSDGRIVIGGFFDKVHGTNRAHIARMLSDGTLDLFFDPGSGADNPVYSIVQSPDGRFAVGGSFTSFDGVSRPGIVMLNTNGSVDFTFNPREGVNGTVYAVALQADGKVLVGGDFTLVGRTPLAYIARLNRDGSVDTSFDPGGGPDGIVRTIGVQADGRILLGGSFTHVNGISRGGLARLDLNGSVDPLFLSTDAGANGSVMDIKFQADGNLIVVGDFTEFNGVTRRRITRLYENGKTDPTINFGAGANSFIATVLVEPDRKLVVGGGFTAVQGQSRRSVARIYGGSIAGPGTIEYSASQYIVSENVGEANIIVRRKGGTTGDLAVDFATIAGATNSGLNAATAGLDYTNVAGTLFFPEGEVEASFTVPIVNDILIESDEAVTLTLANATTGASLGLVPSSTLIIQSDDSSVGFSSPSYTVNENAVAGYAPITVVRTGTTNGSVSVDFTTVPGTAVAPADYTNVSDTITFAPGETNKTFFVPIVNDALVEGMETVNLALLNVTAESQLGLASAVLTIVDDDFSPGRVQFTAPVYIVNEYETNALITVLRTNGSSGVVTVSYNTINGTAVAGPGGDYFTSGGTLTFADGETVKTFNVPIIPDLNVNETNETVTLSLSGVTGGGVLGTPSTAILTIINNTLINGAFGFTATNYNVSESAGVVLLSVTRSFGTSGVVSVDVGTIDGTASNQFDFISATNTLTWTNGDVAPKTVAFTILNDGVVEDPETFQVRLMNPTGGAIVGARGTAQVTILDDDVGPGFLGFSSPTYTVNENATNAVITVTRLAGHTGVVSIDAATVPGGTALPGIDYQPALTNLVFNDGETSKLFIVSIANNFVVSGNKTINLALSNPTGGASTSGRLTAAVLTVIEDDPQAGSNDSGFEIGANAPVNVIVVATNNNKLYVGGDFTQFNNQDFAHLVRLNQSGGVDTTFNPETTSGGVPSATFSNSVRSLAIQSDGLLLVGGLFTNAGNNGINFLARLNPDGSLDQNFMSGLSGPNNFIDAITLQTDGRILIGGAFTIVNGSTVARIARLEASGALDVGFNPGSGANGDVHAVAVARNGSILVGGDFDLFNSNFAAGLARLHPDGSVDSAFNTGLGFDNSVRAIVVQPADNKVIVAGYFKDYDGNSRNGIVRLNVDGSLDSSFNIGSGANEYISALALQPDGKILVGGGFTFFNGVQRNHLVRLNPDGSVDYSFNIGSGADNYINTVAVQTDRKIPLGGGFLHFDGARRNYITRLAGGDNVGSGEFGFEFATNSVLENSTNLTVTVRRFIGSSNAVSVAFATQNGTAVAPTHYAATNGVLTFAPGQTTRTFDVRVVDDISTNADRTFTLALSNPTGGASLGATNRQTVNIVNDDVALVFAFPLFSAVENQGSNVVITVQRLGGTNGAITVEFATGTAGTATPGVDYYPQAGQLLFASGQTTATFLVPIIIDSLVEFTETVELRIFNQSGAYPAGNISIDTPTATLAIVDDDFNGGQISLSSTNYTVGERSGFATITVLRSGGVSGSASVFFNAGAALQNSATPGLDFLATNGLIVFGDGQSVKTFTVPILDDTLVEGPENIAVTLFGPTGAQLGVSSANLVIAADEAVFSFQQATLQVAEGAGSAVITVLRSTNGTGPVSVHFATSDGTAIDGLDYIGTNGTLVFAPGQFSKTFTIPIISDTLGEGSEFLNLTLSTPGGESVLAGGISAAQLFIVDDDVSFSFNAAAYLGFEADGFVDVQVVRLGRTNGVVSVDFNTSDGTAKAGLTNDYVFNSQTLVFADGEIAKIIRVTLVNDAIGEGTETFNVNLSNPSAGATLAAPGSAVVTIFDDEETISFGASAFFVDENAGTASILVVRNGSGSGTVSVQYATTAGTATPGVDYANVSGQLDFGPFETTKTITVPIGDDLAIEGDETFTIRLFNASGTTIITPSNVVVTIVENDTSVVFGAPTFSVSESATNAFIPVYRIGGTTNTVAVTAFTTTGTATPGVDYTPTTNQLVFFPGTTNLSLVIPIRDDLLIEGNETVGLSLASPVGAQLGAQTTATLTIVDDDASIIVEGGVAIITESIAPANGIIDPGETVQVNMALRNIGNVDTTSLVATLLTTNGVTPVTTSQNYGQLAAGGGVVSRPFTFTANGTNGGRITAVLRLQEGSNVLGTVSFPFTLGQNITAFANHSGITINDRLSAVGSPPAAASPYPATNVVSGLAGTITKVTVTIANLTHTFPDDIDILLQSPDGKMTLLMSDAGSSSSTPNPLNGVTLTFDDAAALTIPDSNQIVTATYRPANYNPPPGFADSFPAPAPAGPYTNASLAIFNGSNPNGVWKLYVVDDTTGDAGNIAGGWSIAITTTASVTPQADLSVTATASPDPLNAGATLFNTLLVANNGPGTATGVTLTTALPAGMTFLSASTTLGSCSLVGTQVVCNIGTLASAGSATVTIAGSPTVPGTYLAIATVTGAQSDVVPGNNTAQVKASVLPLMLTIASANHQSVVRWPAPAAGYTLQFAGSPRSTNWVNVTNTPTVVNGKNTVTLDMTNTLRFFRLRAP